jgi:hypothetical protein
MDRLKSSYERAATEYGVFLRHFERDCPRLKDRLNKMDAIVVFTNMVSHEARKKALATGRASGVPVVMCHSCGMSSLKRCLECIMKKDERRAALSGTSSPICD